MQLLPHHFFGPRPGGELFVADDEFAVVDWMIRFVIGWKWNLVAVIEVQPLFGCDARVVWAGEADVHEKGFVPFVVVEKLHRMIGCGSSVMSGGAFGLVVQVSRVIECRVILPRGVASFGFVIGFVAGPLHRLAEGAFDVFGIVAKQGPAAVHHVPAGVTDGGHRRAHAVGVVEHKSTACQFVEVGGLDVRIAQSGDGVGALVVGEEEQHVGAGFLGRNTWCTTE